VLQQAQQQAQTRLQAQAQQHPQAQQQQLPSNQLHQLKEAGRRERSLQDIRLRNDKNVSLSQFTEIK
jgi:hypothetical protein